MKIEKATRHDMPFIRALIHQNPNTLLQKNIPRVQNFFVARYQNKIVGCCALVVYSRKIAEVRSLAVDERFRGQGIATRLIEACIECARQKRVYEIFTITGEKTLFERQGLKMFNNEKYALFKVLRD